MGRGTSGIVLKRVPRKSPPLRPPDFRCLRGVPSVNITRGCAHRCVYCYARGFPEAPPDGEVHLFLNLPEMVERTLSRMKRTPSWVSFSTASDPFQPIEDVLNVTYRVMKLLLEAGIGVVFLTKGTVSEEFIELFRRYRHAVKARVGVVSLREDYWRVFEPGTPRPEARLESARRLKEAGIEVSIRVDPLVPVVTDSEKDLIELFGGIREAGIRDLSLSCLVMRPSIEAFFREGLEERLYRRVLGYYRRQPYRRVITSARTKLLPLSYRRVLYRKALSIAGQLGLRVRICGCKNPDMPWQDCTPWVGLSESAYVKRQGGLFE